MILRKIAEYAINTLLTGILTFLIPPAGVAYVVFALQVAGGSQYWWTCFITLFIGSIWIMGVVIHHIFFSNEPPFISLTKPSCVPQIEIVRHIDI